MLTVVILAAGKGTRMKSDQPKVLFNVAGMAMVDYSIDLSLGLNPNKIVVVTGNCAELVESHVSHKYQNEKIVFARQAMQNGTADAVKCALEHIDNNSKVLILCGDMPLMKLDTIKEFVEKASHAVSFISVKTENPHGYGRVIRTPQGLVLSIVEEKDANENEKRIKEVNTGVYLCNADELKKRISSIGNNNAQKEYYLTDIVHGDADAFIADNEKEFMGVNDRLQLSVAAKTIWKERAEYFMKEGVSILDPDTCYIDKDVIIGRDTTIYPNVFIEKGSEIGENVTIMSGSRIYNSKIDNNVEIKDNSLVEESFIGENSSVGPMAHIRPGSKLMGNNKVGNFVELKKATMGEGSKASHLSYLGDAVLGKNVNIGCGTITCNYDGYNKYETIIEDNVFIGSDTQLVAPVKIGAGALIGAGSTITKDVEADALAISRSPQKNMSERGKMIMEENKAKKEAKGK